MTAEILRLARENNEMLKRIVGYIEKTESVQYRDGEDMRNFAINLLADSLIEIMGNRRQQNNMNYGKSCII